MEFTEKEVRQMLSIQAKKDRIRTEVKQLLGMLGSALNRYCKRMQKEQPEGWGACTVVYKKQINYPHADVPVPRKFFIITAGGKWSFEEQPKFAEAHDLDFTQLSHEDLVIVRRGLPGVIKYLTDLHPKLEKELLEFLVE